MTQRSGWWSLICSTVTLAAAMREGWRRADDVHGLGFRETRRMGGGTREQGVGGPLNHQAARRQRVGAAGTRGSELGRYRGELQEEGDDVFAHNPLAA